MFFSIFVSLLATYVSILLLNALSSKLGLIDRPCTRKVHQGEVPLVGGMSIFFVLLLLLLFVLSYSK